MLANLKEKPILQQRVHFQHSQKEFANEAESFVCTGNKAVLIFIVNASMEHSFDAKNVPHLHISLGRHDMPNFCDK